MFRKGASATENSLISLGRSLIVENNYGYDLVKFNDTIPGVPELGGDRNLVSEPGISRIDIKPDGSGCRKVWTNTTVRAPSVVPKGDAKNGLIYTFENVSDPAGADPWYWTALDYRTGQGGVQAARRRRRPVQQPLRGDRHRAQRDGRDDRVRRRRRRPDGAARSIGGLVKRPFGTPRPRGGSPAGLVLLALNRETNPAASGNPAG